MSKCIGCGITLQNTDALSLGYTKILSNPYCERCFKTRNYNQENKVTAKIDNLKILNKINKLNKFTLFITDLFNLNNEVISCYQRITNKKILVINKSDLIPQNLKLNHLKENIKRVYNIEEDVIFISAKQNLSLTYLIELINNYQEVIIAGATDAGKSTLINLLTDSNLTTSKYQNTTLDFIKLKKDNFIIYDTPGLLVKNQKCLNKIITKTKKLNNDYLLYIDDYIIKGNSNLTLFLSSDKVIKTKKDNEKLNYKIIINKPTDILIDGGFIFIKDKGVIYSNVLLETRDSLIK